MNISEKLEDFRRQFEISRKNFKALAVEMKSLLGHNPEVESRVSENNRIIETFLTSVKNTSLFEVDFNIDKVQETLYDHSMEDLSRNFFTNCFKNEGEDGFLEFNEANPKRHGILAHQKSNELEESFFLEKPRFAMKTPILLEEGIDNPLAQMSLDSIPKPRKKRAPKTKILPDLPQCESICGDQSSREKKTPYKRGPYRAYGVKIKQEAIKMMEEDGKSLKEVSTLLQVPTKNIKRWVKVGPLRKKGLGGGRKTMDPTMESMLFDWCLSEVSRQGKVLSRAAIKQQAKALSRNKGIFKASKGWLDKFMKRFNFSERVREVLGVKEEGMDEEIVMDKEDSEEKPPMGSSKDSRKRPPFFKKEEIF